MKLRYRLTLFWACFAHFVVAQRANLPIHPPSQLLYDLRHLEQRLLRYHPGLFSYQDSATFFQAFDRVEAQIKQHAQGLDARAFFQMVNPLVAQIRCGHTTAQLSASSLANIYRHEALFPFKMQFLEDKAYVHYSYNPPMLLPKGTEILAINGKTMQQLMGILMPNLYTDGYNITGKWHELNNWFWLYYQLLVEPRNHYEITYRLPNDKAIRRQKFKGVNRSQIMLVHQSEQPLQLEIREMDGMGKVAKMTIASFNNEEVADYGQKFKRFLKESFERIRTERASSLILDLRGNQGGNDVNGALLLSYLTNQPFRYYRSLKVNPGTRARLPFFQRLFFKVKPDGSGQQRLLSHRNLGTIKPAKSPFMGRLIVLLDGQSFSATSQFAAVLHNMGRAVFVGEAMSGGYAGNSSGFFFEEVLPNTRLRVSVPAVKYRNAVSLAFGEGWPLDYPVRQNVNTWLNHRDLAMEKALRLLQTGTTASVKQQ